MLLLDTTVLVQWWRNVPTTVTWFNDRVLSEEMGVCVVSVAEVFARAHHADHQRWRELFAALRPWEVTYEDAIVAGTLRYDLARCGFQAGLADALIAAVAVRVGATVVTDNTRDFELLGAAVVRPG